MNRAYKRAYDKAHYDPEKARLKRLRAKEQNPEYHKQWYQRNKEKHCAKARARRKAQYIPNGKPGSVRYEARLAGFRSGFERTINANLLSRGVKFTYETLQVPYILTGTYNPDFILESGIIIEAKGLLDRESKRKMIAVKKQHPELDIRFIFADGDKKVPGTKQTHGQWASRNGYKWADREVPEEWLHE